MTEWNSQRKERKTRLEGASAHSKGKVVATGGVKAFLEAVIHPFDRVYLEGDNQKQADFLARILVTVDPG